MDVQKLFDSMTLEEKCGQMTQICFGIIQSHSLFSSSSIDEKKLVNAIRDNGVGSIFHLPNISAESAKNSQKIIKRVQDVALNETRARIPILYGIDSIHGANFIQEAVLFPQPLNQAATFNRDVARRVGEITALETRAVGIPWNFNPVLDIGRQPLWPRIFETYGEDVCLAVEMGNAYIKGHQGSSETELKSRTKAAACLKHYIGYSAPANGRDRSIAFIPEITLREVYLPTFANAVSAGVPTVMINSATVNSIPGHANSFYINGILKGELKFDGLVVSDWEDIIRLHTRDRIAETPEEAVRIAVMAGVDMSMVPLDFSFRQHCIDLAKKDPEFLKRVNDATMRILKVKEKLGLFENPYPVEEDLALIGTNESELFNLEAARESIILAKNDGNTLPLKPNKKILVTGPTANLLRVLNGGWSYTFQGEEEKYFQTYGRKKLTLLGAIQKKSQHVKYLEGVDFNSPINIEKTIEEAKKSDVVVLCIGEDVYCEVAGNISNLTLSSSQLDLGKRLAAVNKPLVVVYLGGRPRVFTELAEQAQAVVLGFLPGTRGAEAISDILFGDYNPNGRLPITYPLNPNGYTTYDYSLIEVSVGNVVEHLYPFGHGLSYSTFTYSRLRLSSREFENEMKVEVDVRNEGPMSGKHTVMLFLNDEFGSVPRPLRQLKKFEKVNLKAGETVRVEFVLNFYDLSFIGLDHKRIVERGKFNVYIGELTDYFVLNKIPDNLKL